MGDGDSYYGSTKIPVPRMIPPPSAPGELVYSMGGGISTGKPDITITEIMSIAQNESDERVDAAKEWWQRVYTLMEQTASDIRDKVELVKKHWNSGGADSFLSNVGDTLRVVDLWMDTASANVSELTALASAISTFQKNMRQLWIEYQFTQEKSHSTAMEEATGHLEKLEFAYQAPLTWDDTVGPRTTSRGFMLGPEAFTGPLNARLVSPTQLQQALSRFVVQPGSGSAPGQLASTPTRPAPPPTPPAPPVAPPASANPTAPAPPGMAPPALTPVPPGMGVGRGLAGRANPTSPAVPAPLTSAPRRLSPPGGGAPGDRGLAGRNTPPTPPPGSTGRGPSSPGLGGRDGGPPGVPPGSSAKPTNPGRQSGQPPLGSPNRRRQNPQSPGTQPPGTQSPGRQSPGKQSPGSQPAATQRPGRQRRPDGTVGQPGRLIPPEFGPSLPPDGPPGTIRPGTSELYGRANNAPAADGKSDPGVRTSAETPAPATRPAAVRPGTPLDDVLAPTVTPTDIGGRPRSAPGGSDSNPGSGETRPAVRSGLDGRNTGTQPAPAPAPAVAPGNAGEPKRPQRERYETNATEQERFWLDTGAPEPVISVPEKYQPPPDQKALGT